MLVREAMATEPVTVRRHTSVKKALVMLAEHRITAMPVVDGHGRVQGVVSEADLIQHVAAHDARAWERPVTIEPLSTPLTVEDVYTRAVVTIAPDDDVAAAAELMTVTGAKSLPVLDRNHLVGMISRSDIVRALARTDDTISAEVSRLLEAAGHHDWLVAVDDGLVSIDGPADLGQSSLARTLASTVAGVVAVRVDA